MKLLKRQAIKNNFQVTKIKTKFILSLVFYIVFNLVIPNQKVLANFNFTNNLTNLTQYTNSEEILVKVVSAPLNSSSEIKTNYSNFKVSTNCTNFITKSDVNLIQQPHLVNLNEPANCYNLTVAQLLFAQNKLAVEPLVKGLQTVKVLISKSLIQLPIYSKSTESQNTPIIPVTSSFVLLSYFIIKAKKIIVSKNTSNDYNYNSISLDFLQVYRC